jgi:hypothetical protein
MDSIHASNRLASQLLQLDDVHDPQYKEYRMSLENALTRAERRERWMGRIAGSAFLVGMILMFVGGSKVVGDFDPWSKDATIFSAALGVIYVIASFAWPLSLAAYFARLRPKIRDLKEQIRDTSLLALHSEVAQLRTELHARTSRENQA